MLTGKSGKSYLLRVFCPLFLALLLALCLDFFLQVRKPGRAWSAGRYGFSNPSLDLKFPQFFKNISDGSIPDVIFVGNSMASHDLHPQSFSAGFAETGGFSPRCFNLGSRGMNRNRVKDLLLIINRYAGKSLVIWGCTFTEFRVHTFKSEHPLLRSNDWLRFRMGKWNLRGWMTEHSRLIRVFSLLRLRLEFPASWREYLRFARYPLKNGYFLRNRIPDKKLTDQKLNRIMQKYRGTDMPRDLVPTISETLRHAEHINLFVAILPVHRVLAAGMIEQGLNPARENDRLIKAWDHVGYDAIGPPEHISGNDEYWIDFNHMNHPGAEQYSYWLGRQLGTRLKSGRLKTAATGER